MKRITYIYYLLTAWLLYSCGDTDIQYDATGSFEAVETIISAQANGRLEKFDLEEGQEVKAGQEIGYVDTTQLYLQKQKITAQIDAVLSRKPEISVQLQALRQQLATAKDEKMRVKRLVESDAATSKQLDDVKAQIKVLEAKIDAVKSNLTISTEGLEKEIAPLRTQMMILDDQIRKSILTIPKSGKVLSTFVEQYEMVGAGKPMYKIADLSTMVLRIYLTGDQLPQVKLNQELTIFADDGEGGYTESTGKLTWISDKAEFTPKTVQTKDERANKVYAAKVLVPNDGTYKIGMYGQVNF